MAGNGDRPPYIPGENRRGDTPGRRTLTAVEAEEEILRLSHEIDDLLSDLADQAVDKARKEHAYGLAKAQQNLLAATFPGNGKGGNTTVDERESHVTVNTEDYWLDHLIAEAIYNVTKERIHAKRDQIKSLQTISANIRAMTTGGGA